MSWSEVGDCWVYTAVKRCSYLFVAFAVGKWTQMICSEVVQKLGGVTMRSSCFDVLNLFTDGNDGYMFVLSKYYPFGVCGLWAIGEG